MAVFKKLKQENKENNNNKVSYRQPAKVAKIQNSMANKIIQEMLEFEYMSI